MHAIKKEKVRNPSTGRMEDPDEQMMREVERTLEISGRADDFRQSLIAKIGAWSLDHPGQAPDYRKLFPRYIEKMEEEYYGQRRKVIGKAILSMLTYRGDGQSQMSED